MFQAKVYITLKKNILDPQGKTVKSALETLGFQGIKDVRLGKYIEISIEGKERSAVEKQIQEMSEKLLANPVIEDYHFEVQG
jgi:phosphoribosylformylglycinamidine synthase